MKKLIFIMAVTGIVTGLQAQVLFYTDFRTTPAGIKALCDLATAANADHIVVQNPAGATAPKDTVVDGCTFSANKSSTTITSVVISKATQSFVPYGDTAGCTPGRLGLKNSMNSFTTPSVQGPCTITYYCAGSSATAGRQIMVTINGVSTPDAGFTELTIPGPTGAAVQATRKMVYSYTSTGPCVISLIGNGGGVYLYDVKIEAGVSIKHSPAIARTNAIQINGYVVKNNSKARIDFYSLSGAKVFSSNAAVISLRTISKGVYFARVSGTNEGIKFIR